MTLLDRLRTFTARKAQQHALLAEMSALSDAELRDLDLSYAKLVAMARAQAGAA